MTDGSEYRSEARFECFERGWVVLLDHFGGGRARTDDADHHFHKPADESATWRRIGKG